jgi:hypothetical protein
MRPWAKSILAAAAWLWTLSAAPAAADDKTATLDALLSGLQAQRSLLVERLELAEGKRALLAREKALYEEELRQAAARPEEALSRAGAPANGRRTEYNLRLLQHLSAVVAALESRAEAFRSAIDILDFYARKVREEHTYLRTVSAADLSRLSAEITAILEEHARQARKPLVVASELELRSLEAVRAEALGPPPPRPKEASRR